MGQWSVVDVSVGVGDPAQQAADFERVLAERVERRNVELVGGRGGDRVRDRVGVAVHSQESSRLGEVALQLGEVTAHWRAVGGFERLGLTAGERAEGNNEIARRRLVHVLILPANGIDRPATPCHRECSAGHAAGDVPEKIECSCGALGTKGVMHATNSRRSVQRITIRVAWDALIIVLAYQAYRLVRIAAESKRPVAITHGESLLWWERQVGLAWEQGMQALILDRRPLIDACNVVYTWMFWPIVTGTLLVLHIRDRALYRRYRNALFLSGALGLVVFAVFPVAPPRMLDGFVDTVHVYSRTGGVAHPGKFTNAYAAMPSFHVGWLVLAGVAAMPALPRRRLRPVLLLPGLVMLFVVMATANHYLIDGIVGAAVALGGLAAADQLPSPEWGRVQRILIGPDALIALGGVVDLMSGQAAGALPPRSGAAGRHGIADARIRPPARDRRAEVARATPAGARVAVPDRAERAPDERTLVGYGRWLSRMRSSSAPDPTA